MAEESVYFPALLGNDSLKRRLGKDIAENHLSHAYIIEGPRGSGRHTVAMSVVAAIECQARESVGLTDLFGETSDAQIPCGGCPSCQKILSGKSPDIITAGLEDERVTMGVDSIRRLKEDIYIAPNDLSVKVYIIEDCDAMTEQAQNAFLLSLEEPPEYVVFFLLCESSMNLLETIRSRAPTLRTTRLTPEIIGSYLIANVPTAKTLSYENPKDFETLLFIADGRLGYAIELLDKKTRDSIFANRNEVKKLLSLLLRSNRTVAFESIGSFGKKRHEAINRITLLQYALRDLILLKKSEDLPLCFFEDAEEALELSTRFTSKSLLALYDAAARAKKDLESNANVKLALTNMMLSAGLI